MQGLDFALKISATVILFIGTIFAVLSYIERKKQNKNK